MISYLDTHVAAWIALGRIDRLSPAAIEQIRKTDSWISGAVLLELEYLFEIRRFSLPALDIARKLEREARLRVCKITLDEIAAAALGEKWTRDPFDRLIVANAKANGLSPLVTADRAIRQQYPRAIW